MAIELPDEVVSFLSFIGINWPTVNEDRVREFASHVREFADNVDAAHRDSTGTVQRLGEAYQGASYETLAAKWAQMSDSHMNEPVQACHVVATALDAAADVIVAMKLETIAELVVMAAAFVADQAAAVATPGAAEAAVVAIEVAARKLVNYLEQQLEQYIIAQVIEAAIDPLVAVVSRAVSGLVYEAAEATLGVSGDTGGAGRGFRIDPDALEAHAEIMHRQAETVANHAEVFRSRIAGVSFE
ncbi:WXG100 family type VII secretion target [Kitasatospora sp. NPDC056138]|uniref:WXG100-like domain-containing protein n=1 Tax=Kitasatospora sp. NPDC056138 TaxID=3345724 RepID=UPI0035E1DA06